MKDDSRYVLSKIEAVKHESWGPSIELINFEHCDYIEDVLAEVFDVEYSFYQTDNDEEYTLFFDDNISFELLCKIIVEVNIYHETNKKEYVLPSST